MTSRPVVDMARQTSTGAIFDLSPRLTPDISPGSQAAGATDIKISSDQSMDPAIEAGLRQAGVHTVWIEYHPALTAGAPEEFLDGCTNCRHRSTVFPSAGISNFCSAHFGPVRPGGSGPQGQRSRRLCQQGNNKRALRDLEGRDPEPPQGGAPGDGLGRCGHARGCRGLSVQRGKGVSFSRVSTGRRIWYPPTRA